MAEKSTATRILHCFSMLTESEEAARAARLMSALGRDFVHDVVSREPADSGAASHLLKGVRARLRDDFPALEGRPTPGRLVSIAQAMKPYDLVLTYDRGALDAVMAHTVFAQALGLPPLIHHDSGTGETKRRDWYRRIAFGRTHRIVVPTRALERTARDVWKQPPERIARIPGGIDTAAFARKPQPKGLRLVKRKGERWVGTFAGLHPHHRLSELVEACSRLPENWHLVIFGDGQQRDAIADAATSMEVSDRVHLPGEVEDRARVIGLFDLYAEPGPGDLAFPYRALEAMAAGLPVAAPGGEGIGEIVSEPNRPFVAGPGDVAAFAAVLQELVEDDELRKTIGAANRERARAQFDESRMIEAYCDLYRGVFRHES